MKTVALVIALAATPAYAQPIETLSPKDIADAIHLGTYGEPKAYLVHNFERPPEEVNQGVLAVIYTPFVRVALAAKAATEKGITFEPSDVTDEMIAAVFYVAFRLYCCVHPETENGHPRTQPFDYQVAEPGRPGSRLSPDWAVTAKPLWVTREVERFGPLPYDDIGLVAAYPMSVIQHHRGYVLYQQWPSARVPGLFDYEFRVGRVTSADLARWR